MAEKKLQVMISSTVRDLEEYRAEAKDACWKCGMFPDLMENRPAQDTEAITASKTMVNNADIAVEIAHGRNSRFHEAVSLQFLGSVLAVREKADTAEVSLQRSQRLAVGEGYKQVRGTVNYYLAQRAVWKEEFKAARSFADISWVLADDMKLEADFIRSARMQGEAALGLGGFKTADDRLYHALTRARTVNLIEGELPALIALAALRRKQGDEKAARELLEDFWEFAERGPYRCFMPMR
jgi:hypothetical protein